MTPRATALLAVRPAKMYSCIFRQSKRAASAACKKARQCSSMSPRDRRAGRLRTSGLRNSNFVRKGAANAAALFWLGSSWNLGRWKLQSAALQHDGQFLFDLAEAKLAILVRLF